MMYMPDRAKGNKVDNSLPAHGSLTIGYGAGGGQPRQYWLRPGQEIDIGFLKLFVTTQWIDFTNIAQPSPFSDDGRAQSEVKISNKNLALWDSILVTLVQRSGCTPPQD